VLYRYRIIIVIIVIVLVIQMYCGSATHFLCVIDSEFLAKESNEHFWSFVEAVTQFALDSPECEYGNY